MPVQNQANELITQKHLRAYLAPGGAGPDVLPLYAGQDSSYVSIESVNSPITGSVKPFFIHDPRQVGTYKNTAMMISAPDIASADITIQEKRGLIPRQYLMPACHINIYEAVGDCRDLSDMDLGWSQYVLIYPDGVITTRDFGARSSFADDNPATAKLGVQFSRPIYPAGPVAFGTTGPTLTGILIQDVIYGGGPTCPNCGVNNDGTQWLYAVPTPATGTKPNIYYSTNGGATWSSVAIAAAANDEVIVAVDVAGSNLICVSKTAGGAGNGGYYLSVIDPVTGIPGTPTKITAGFVASSAPNDLVVLSPREIWFCGDAGYIYKCTDPTAGVTVSSAAGATSANLIRIDASPEIIVCAGATTALVYTTNKGVSWSVPANVPDSAVTYNALCVIDKFLWWIGTSGGAVWYTKNGGATAWTAKTMETGLAVIYDIKFATPEVGWIAAATATPTARIYATINGGYSWTRSASRVNGVGTFSRASRFAIPQTTDPTILANYVAVGGLAATATNGYLAIGAAAIR